MNIRSWLKNSYATLSSAKIQKHDAEILLSFVIAKPRSWLIAFDNTLLSQEQLAQLNALVERRAHGVPVAYLTGEREFWSLPLTVSPVTLIPRHDTEILVEQALLHLPTHAVDILDLGTGTGAIALALASEHPNCRIIGVDRVPEAVKLANNNANKLGINNTIFLISDWFSILEERRFGMIVSNPPYIDADDLHLQQGDLRFEPHSALVAAELGLADIRHIIKTARRHLLSNSWLILEHGWQQAEAVRTLFADNNYQKIATCQDYTGQDRVTFGIY